LYFYLCRVLGQVSCELVSPKLNRPTEGILFFNLELSQMAAPAFEPGRYLDLSQAALTIENPTAVYCYFNISCCIS
jgi:exosome complex RNA-binding protein Rrp42 (RNase PH superfamily)